MYSRQISTASILAGLSSIGLTLHSAYKANLHSEQVANIVNQVTAQCPDCKDIQRDMDNLQGSLFNTSHYLGILSILIYGTPAAISLLESGPNWILWGERLKNLNQHWDFFLGTALQATGLSLCGGACYEAGALNTQKAMFLGIAGIFAEKIGSELVINHKLRHQDRLEEKTDFQVPSLG